MLRSGLEPDLPALPGTSPRPRLMNDLDNIGECEPVPATNLLDLPSSMLLLVLELCDPFSLCSLARSCNALLRLASSPTVWPDFRDDGTILACIRKTLSHVLHLPPQAFLLLDDTRRSSKFCVACPLHNLRGRMGVVDVEELAASTSLSIQDLVDRLPRWRAAWRPLEALEPPEGVKSCCLGFDAPTGHGAPDGIPAARSMPSYAIIQVCGACGCGQPVQVHAAEASPCTYTYIQVCRADRGTLRFSLNPAAAVALTLSEQLGGLPPAPWLCPVAGPAAWASAPQGSNGLRAPVHLMAEWAPPPSPSLRSAGNGDGDGHAADRSGEVAHGAATRPPPFGTVGAGGGSAGDEGKDGGSSSGAGGSSSVAWSELRLRLSQASLSRTQKLLAKRRQAGCADFREGLPPPRDPVRLMESSLACRGCPLTSGTAPMAASAGAVVSAGAAGAGPDTARGMRVARGGGGSAWSSDATEDKSAPALFTVRNHLRALIARRKPSDPDVEAYSPDTEAWADVSVRLTLLLLDICPANAATTAFGGGGGSGSSESQMLALRLASASLRSGPLVHCAKLLADVRWRQALLRAFQLVLQLAELGRVWNGVEVAAAAAAAAAATKIVGAASGSPIGSEAAPRPGIVAHPLLQELAFSCPGLTASELQEVVHGSTEMDVLACVQSLAHFTPSLRRAAAGGGPDELLALLSGACAAAQQYSQPPEQYGGALGTLGSASSSREAYVGELGRALHAVRCGAGAGAIGGAGGQEGEGGALQGTVTRLVMLRSCMQAACWSAWCLAVI